MNNITNTAHFYPNISPTNKEAEIQLDEQKISGETKKKECVLGKRKISRISESSSSQVIDDTVFFTILANYTQKKKDWSRITRDYVKLSGKAVFKKNLRARYDQLWREQICIFDKLPVHKPDLHLPPPSFHQSPLRISPRKFSENNFSEPNLSSDTNFETFGGDKDLLQDAIFFPITKPRRQIDESILIQARSYHFEAVEGRWNLIAETYARWSGQEISAEDLKARYIEIRRSS